VARVLAIGVPLAMFLLWWGIWGGHAEVESVSETTATPHEGADDAHAVQRRRAAF
jgi:hypothetical protein